MIKRSVTTAVIVDTRTPRLTITDYFHPAEDVIGQFLKDYMLIGENKLTLRALDATAVRAPTPRGVVTVGSRSSNFWRLRGSLCMTVSSIAVSMFDGVRTRYDGRVVNRHSSGTNAIPSVRK
jgi:hypothetical protein